jgi:hypothetical protein
MVKKYVVGDVHGQLDKLVAVLQQAGLMDEQLHWAGDDATLWFMGDFFDRGPDGVGAVDLVRQLQQDAPGQVKALLGNHDLLILGALRLPGAPTSGPSGTMYKDWMRNGGEPSDLARLTPAHVEWLLTLPAMAHEGDVLLAHAGAWFYTRYGRTVAEVNAAFASLLRSDDAQAWDRILNDFSERLTFQQEPAKTAEFLRIYGGRRLVHGHTPLAYMTDVTTQAYTYANGLCTNVDPGLYRGGTGFVYELT